MISQRTQFLSSLTIILGFLLSISGPQLAIAQQHDTPCSSTILCNETAFLECVPQYNQYSEGTCRCKPGLIWHVVAQECRAAANSTCSLSDLPTEPKCVPNAICDPATTICKCNSPYYIPAIGSFCLAGYQTLCGDETEQWAQCDISLRLVCAGPDPANQICQCAGSWIWSPTRGKCVSTIETSAACMQDDDCVDNAFCAVGFGIQRCRCGPGHSKNAENSCSKSYGVTCSANAECNSFDYLTCLNGTCGCQSPRVDVNGKCLGLAGDNCRSHSECTGRTTCHSTTGKCFCSMQQGNMELADRTCGYLGQRAGSYCRLGGYDCSALDYLTCKEILGATYGLCECQASMIPNEQGRCVRRLGDACTTINHNCIENSGCIENVCSCLSGSLPNIDNTRCTKLLGQQCNVGSASPPCQSEYGLVCRSGACNCPIGQEWSDAKMHCVALVAGNCTTGSENYCTTHASCNSVGICECQPGYSQHNEADRHCLASHGTSCGSSSSNLTACNQEQYLVCSSSASKCSCQYPTQQIWDSEIGKCVSIVGAYCGENLIENAGRPEMECVASTSCVLDSNRVSKCRCADEGMLETGDGRCEFPVIQTEVPEPTTESPVDPVTDGATEAGVKNSGLGILGITILLYLLNF